jgi:AraC-like DNA-binding protein
MFLISGSLIIALGTIVFSGKILFLPHLLRIDSPIHYFILPFGYFIVCAQFKPDFKFKWTHLLNFLPFLFNLIEFLPFYFKNDEFKIDYYTNFISTHGSPRLPFHFMFKIFIGIVYLVLQFYVFFKYKPKQINKSGLLRLTIIWFWIFLLGQAIMYAGLLIERSLENHLFTNPFSFYITVISFLIYDISISLMFFPAILYGNQIIPEANPIKDKYERSKLNADSKNIILDKLDDFLNSKEKPYLNPMITLNEVSLLLEISINHLSQVINEKTNMNFNDYINKYRINEAKLILLSPQYQKITIDAIAKMAGFNSKSAFYAAFKKHLGMNPKEFIKRGE